MRNLFTFILISIAISCSAQQSNPGGYTDMVTKGNKLLALTQGRIKIFDTSTGKTIDADINGNENIIAIDTDKKGNIVAVKKDQTIAVLDEKAMAFKTLLTSEKPVYNVVFDHNNNSYLITDNGITVTSTGKNYAPDSSFTHNHQLRKPWSKSSVLAIDNDDNIWIGSAHGEWGGELFAFNTKTTQFVKLDINGVKINGYPIIRLYGVQSISAINGSVYVGFDFGSGHPDGHLLKFTGLKCDSVFLSRTIWPVPKDPPGIQTIWEDEYAGPAIYNEKDECIYFYSHYGIRKGQVNQDLSKPGAWVHFPASQLKWISRNPKMPDIDVIKMTVAENGKLYLLSQNNGIGVFNGKTFAVLN